MDSCLFLGGGSSSVVVVFVCVCVCVFFFGGGGREFISFWGEASPAPLFSFRNWQPTCKLDSIRRLLFSLIFPLQHHPTPLSPGRHPGPDLATPTGASGGGGA